MLFDRYPRFEGFQETPRKRSYLLRKQRAERDAYPLFSDHIAVEQPTVDEVMARRRLLAMTTEASYRQLKAKWWRIARTTYYGLSPTEKAYVLDRWKHWTGPRNSNCLLYLCSQTKV